MTGVFWIIYFVVVFYLAFEGLLIDPSYMLGAGWQEKSSATTWVHAIIPAAIQRRMGRKMLADKDHSHDWLIMVYSRVRWFLNYQFCLEIDKRDTSLFTSYFFIDKIVIQIFIFNRMQRNVQQTVHSMWGTVQELHDNIFMCNESLNVKNRLFPHLIRSVTSGEQYIIEHSHFPCNLTFFFLSIPVRAHNLRLQFKVLLYFQCPFVQSVIADTIHKLHTTCVGHYISRLVRSNSCTAKSAIRIERIVQIYFNIT